MFTQKSSLVQVLVTGKVSKITIPNLGSDCHCNGTFRFVYDRMCKVHFCWFQYVHINSMLHLNNGKWEVWYSFFVNQFQFYHYLFLNSSVSCVVPKQQPFSCTDILVPLDNYISRGTAHFLTCKEPDYQQSLWSMISSVSSFVVIVVACRWTTVRGK